jgi:hypothetical protein
MKRLQRVLIVAGVIGALLVGCSSSGQQIEDILSAAEQTAMAQVTFVPVTYTPDVNTIVSLTFAAMTGQAVVPPSPTLNAATSTSTPTLTVTPTPMPGSISGTLSYPSEFIPELRVVAFSVGGFNYRYVETMENQGTYQITGLPPGKYHVVAYVVDGSLAGGYTLAVSCGLSIECADHSLIDVTVTSAQDTPDINPVDWYAPEGFFPPMP